MPRKNQLAEAATGEGKARKPKPETVGVVLADQHKEALEILQALSGLSRSDVIRQLIDQSLHYYLRNDTALNIVLGRDELQQKLLAALREAGSDTIGPDRFVRRVLAFGHAGPTGFYEGCLHFEGFVVYEADVVEDGVKRTRKFTTVLIGEVHPGKELRVDWGPDYEDGDYGPVNFLEF